MKSHEPELRVEQCRSGAVTARVRDRYLHSRFDPDREAARFVETIATGNARLILFLGPGLGHALKPLRARFPHAKLLGIFLHTQTYTAADSSCDGSWHPHSDESLEHFLGRSIPEMLVGQVALVEWQPALDAFAEVSTPIRTTIAAFLRQSQASLFTTGATGRLRLHNALKNLPRIRSTSWRSDPHTRVSAVVVAGAGPSLERVIPLIKRSRSAISLWATGSSVQAFLASGVMPDVIVVTEPSIYASFHLRSLLGSHADVDHPIVLAPVSVCSRVAEAPRISFFGEGDLPERLLATALPKLVRIPSQGTVTFTAVGLARAFGPHPVVLAGADFAHLHERSHVRPHLAHDYRRSISSRTSPGAGVVFERTRHHSTLPEGWSSDRTLATYAHWLESRGGTALAPLYQLCPSAVQTGLKTLTDDEFLALPSDYPAPVVTVETSHVAPRGAALQALEEIATDVSAAKAAPPPEIETLPGSKLGSLGAHLSVQQLLQFVSSGGNAEWDNLCSTVEQELLRAMEFVS